MPRMRRFAILIMSTMLTLGVVTPFAGPAVAGPVSPGPGLVTCTAAGSIEVMNGPVSTWQVFGVGSCQGDEEGPYSLSFSGVGTSSSLGLCDDDPELIVHNLNITVSMSLVPVIGVPRTFVQNWSAPVTTYPLTTPFTISGDGQSGVGAMNSRIFLQCPAAGTPVAQFDLAFYDD